MTINEIKLAILKGAFAHLTHENETSYPHPTNKNSFMCNAITLSAKGLKLDELIANSIRDEIEDRLGMHLQGYLTETYGVLFKDITPAMTQPIRRGILSQMVAKYEKLVAEEADGKVEARLQIQLKIDILQDIKADWVVAGYVKEFVCHQVGDKVRGDPLRSDAAKCILGDIEQYIFPYGTVDSYTYYKHGRESVEGEVAEERIKMVDTLIARYEAELEAV